jgi:heme-degrading monooxygenase HmoA
MRVAWGCRVRDTGLADYRATPGNLGALIAVRDLDDDRAEVITLSRWPSMDAIRGFAGDDVERAAYYPQDDRYLLTKPEKVQHYQSHGAFDPPTHGEAISVGSRSASDPAARTTSRRSASSSTSSCAAPRVRSNPMLLG